MAFAKLQGNRLKIYGEITENHAIMVDQLKCDGEYNISESAIYRLYPGPGPHSFW